MKELNWFKGKFRDYEDNPNNKAIELKMEEMGWNYRFGFFDDTYYYFEKGRLYFDSSKPKKGVEITYEQFENWILNDIHIQSEPQYEIY